MFYKKRKRQIYRNKEVAYDTTIQRRCSTVGVGAALQQEQAVCAL